jgi:hypothetical protein
MVPIQKKQKTEGVAESFLRGSITEFVAVHIAKAAANALAEQSTEHVDALAERDAECAQTPSCEGYRGSCEGYRGSCGGYRGSCEGYRGSCEGLCGIIETELAW